MSKMSELQWELTHDEQGNPLPEPTNEPMAEIPLTNPMALALQALPSLFDFDPYDPKHTMQHPGGGLSSIRGPKPENDGDDPTI